MLIYDTMQRKKVEFISIEENKIKMYVCGQTTYDYCHLGHARKEIVFDTIRRWFIASGYEVIYVENITDIDDKIITRAREHNQNIEQFTNRYIEFMHEDFNKLGIMKPDFEPRATQYINEMIKIIQGLIKKGFAYQIANGDVCYSVEKFKNYGMLSGKSLENIVAGERVEIDVNKQNPLDFVLWKKSKDGEPYWESPFGNGRPGWHIECSAMSEALLGKTFDIHGGGQDLQFPHHENEIAQSETHNDCKFANYWMHNGFLNVDDEKMSKSLGNFLTLRNLLEDYDSEVIKYFMLKTHYRSPLNFRFSLLNEAKHELTKFYLAIKEFNINFDEQSILNWDNEYAVKFKQAMDDDFNTPLAISILFEILTQINIKKDHELALLIVQLFNILGILTKNPLDFLQHNSQLSVVLIEEMIEQRNQAKIQKNYFLADSIRNKLKEKGIIIEDSINGTQWRKI